MIRIISLVLFTVLIFTQFTTAFAQNECTPDTPDNCLDGVGPAVTNPDTVRMTSSKLTDQLGKISGEEEDENVSLIGSSALTGLSAGNEFTGWGIWASYNNNNFEADIPINSVVQPIASYDANQNNIIAGADTLLMDGLVIGAAFGYEATDTSTKYNGGDNDADGFTVASYLAYLINDVFSIDAVAGYTLLDYETDRIDNVSGGTIVGEFDADRWFVATNLNALINHEQWVINGRVGYLYTEEEQDGYQETGPNTARTILDRHIDLSQVLVGLDIAYNFNRLEPYATITYYNDFGRDNGTEAGGLPGSVGATQPDDDDEFRTGFGFRYFGEVISGSLEWTKVIERDTFDGNSIILTIRADL